MACDHLRQQRDTLLDGNIRQSNKARMRPAMQMDQGAEVRVHRDQDSAFGPGLFQQDAIARILANVPGIKNIVPVATEPLDQAPTDASVGKESHECATDTAASVSPAITACAYAAHARMSSGSNSG